MGGGLALLLSPSIQKEGKRRDFEREGMHNREEETT